MTKEEAREKLITNLGVHYPDTRHLPNIHADTCVADIMFDVDAYAQKSVDAALSDTLGLLEALAMLGSDPTWKRVSVNFCPETGMFTCLYWKQDALDFTELPRAEAEALLEVHDDA